MGQRQCQESHADEEAAPAAESAETSSPPHDAFTLQVRKAPGERYGLKLQWAGGTPPGLRILGMEPGGAFARAVRTAGVEGRAIGGIIIAANGISGSERRMDAELDGPSVELLIQPPATVEAAPLLGGVTAGEERRSSAPGGTSSPPVGGKDQGSLTSVIGRSHSPGLGKTPEPHTHAGDD